jgi:hypothetical protein
VTDRLRASVLARIGRRGAALLFFTLLDFVYCLSLLTTPRPLTPLYAWMDSVVPLAVWAAGWGLVGAICLWYAFCLYDTPAFTAAVALKVAWGLTALFGFITGAVPTGYVSAVIWLAFAAFVFLIAGGIPPATPRRHAWTQ